MPHIFISYRRKDTNETARRIFVALENEFGEGSVFIDVDVILGGEEFPKRLQASLEQCHVLLALIGPRWMEDNRLDNPDDFVRLEIEQAFSRGLPVLPLLIDGAKMPSAEHLPTSLGQLPSLHALPIEGAQGQPGQVDRLVRDLKRLLGTRLSSGEPLLHAEKLRLQTIINNDVDDLCFILNPGAATPFDDFGFRICTAKHGSFFCFTSGGNLVVADRAGNTMTSYPAMGSSLEDGHAFFSIDLRVGKQAIPQHALVRLRLGDLETATLDFLVKPRATRPGDTPYAVSVMAVVSNWLVACGTFHLKRADEGISLPVFKDFVSASPFADDLELRVVSSHHAAPAGEDLENNALDAMLTTIRGLASRSRLISEAIRPPSSTAPSYRVPVSFHFNIHINRMIEHYGYGNIGEARVLAHKLAPGELPRRPGIKAGRLGGGSFGEAGPQVQPGKSQRTQITALFRMAPLQHMLVDMSLQAPPQPLQALVGWMLSYWTFLDSRDRAQYTEFPLGRVVVLCPADQGTWLWLLEVERLHSGWEPKWTFDQEDKLALAKEGIGALGRCTSVWSLIREDSPE